MGGLLVRWVVYGLATVTVGHRRPGRRRFWLAALGIAAIASTASMPDGHLADDLVGVGGAERPPRASSRTMKNCDPTEFGLRGAGHGDGAAAVRRRDRLVLDRVRRPPVPTGPVHVGSPAELTVATLDHEARDEPVEDHAVVEAARGQRDEVAGRDRRQVGLDLDRDRALVRLDRHGPRLAGGERLRGWRRRQHPAMADADGRRGGAAAPRGAARRSRRAAAAGATRRAQRRDAASATTATARRRRVAAEVMRRPPGRRESRWPRRGGPRRG